MKYWSFKIFVNNNGKKDFEDWVKELHVKDQNKLDWIVDHLEVTKTWSMPHYKKISGCKRLCELRWFGQNNVPYRPLGCFGPKDNDFTILIGAIEDNGKYKPRNAFKTAMKRIKLIHIEGRTDDY